MKDLVVYLPETRAYGLNYAPIPDDFFTTGRIFVCGDSPNRWGQYRYQPMEGGEGHDEIPEFFCNLMDLPAVPNPFFSARLSGTEEIIVGNRRYLLRLNVQDWSDYSVFYQFPQKSLALKGLVPNAVYKVQAWSVANRVIQIEGIGGRYYAGLFEPVNRVN